MEKVLGIRLSLQWRHNGGHGVSNHQNNDCLLNRLFRHRWNKTSKLRVTGLCEGNSPVTGELPAQRASYTEHVPIWWRHHDCSALSISGGHFSPNDSRKTTSRKTTNRNGCLSWVQSFTEVFPSSLCWVHYRVIIFWDVSRGYSTFLIRKIYHNSSVR